MEITKIQLEESLLNIAYMFGKKNIYTILLENSTLPEFTERIALLLFDNGISEHNIYEKYIEDLKNLKEYRKELREKGHVNFKKLSMFESLKELTETDRYNKKLDSIIVEKFTDYSRYLNKLDGLTKEQFEKFIEWEKKVEEQGYKRGVLTTSNILYRLIGEIPVDEYYEPTEDDGPFFVGCQKYGDITVKTFCGQGCYHTVSFKDELTFTTN